MVRRGPLQRSVAILVGVSLAVLLAVCFGVLLRPDARGSTADGAPPAGSARIDSLTGTPLADAPAGWLAGSRLGRTRLGGLYLRGGALMPWLLLAAVCGASFSIERVVRLRHAKTDARKLIGSVILTLRTEGAEAAAQLCQRSRGPIAAILHAGLQRVHQGPIAVAQACESAAALEHVYLERGLNRLAAVVNVAPLLGFLGTVTGLLHAFDAAGAAGGPPARLVAAGCAEALIAAATGLLVAVPCALVYRHFTVADARFVTEMQESAGELISEVARLSGPGD